MAQFWLFWLIWIQTPEDSFNELLDYLPSRLHERALNYELVQCPACKIEVSVKSQPFLEEARDAECKNHHTFNEFAVYEDLYNTFPLAKSIADKITKTVYSSYHLERNGAHAGEIAKIETWLHHHRFEALLRQIVQDSVKFGNCLLYFAGKDLKRVNLPDASFSFSRENSSHPFSVILYGRRRISYSEIIHFKNEKDTALGSSCFGGWLENFYSMKISLEALHNASRNGQVAYLFPRNTVEGVIDFHEDRLLEYGERQTSDALILSRRSDIERTVTRSIFPTILGRDSTTNHFPTLVLS